MIRYFEINGAQEPADFNIMTSATLARECGTDITGLVEKLQSYTNEIDYIDFAAKVGVEALNAGAKRNATGKTFTVYDLYDAFTANFALAAELITAFVQAMTGESVFPAPAETLAEKKKGKMVRQE